MSTMEFEIKQFKPNYAKKWDEFVEVNDDSTFYHQIGWKKLIEDIYGYRSYYYFAENDIGDIVGIFPAFYVNNPFFGKRVVSVPFAPYGGVCANDSDIGKALVDTLVDTGKKLGADYCEFRNFDVNDHISDIGYTQDYSTFILDISNGADHIWNNMNKKIRNMVRRGDKNDLTFEISSDSSLIPKFHEIYSINMKRLGTPTHSCRFFEELYSAFPGKVLISLSHFGSTPISSIYILKFKGTVISGWGSSLPESLIYAPNDFIYWNAIKWASKNEFYYFDFGRSLIGSGNKLFKERWGCTEVPLYYYNHYYSIRNTSSTTPQNKYKKFTKFWSVLPLSLTKIIGPKIRRHII